MIDIENMYRSELFKNGFREELSKGSYAPIGTLYSVPEKLGKGVYWVYAQKGLYDIKIHDFYFYEDSFFSFEMPEGCLGVCYYDSISGEEISPYRRLTAGCVKSLIGGCEPCKTLVHKNIPVRTIDIEITPSYYEKYLKETFPDECVDVHDAFCNIALTDRFPNMVHLLRQILNYHGDGIAAKLFYEAKVAEAISLIMEHNKKRKALPVKISGTDVRALENVAAYINDHFNCDIPIDQLSRIACMGRTKLKLAFKGIYDCAITEYIQQRRLSHAETLLSRTDFTVEQVAAAIGYHNAGRFANMFQKSTGLYPSEYRKMAQKQYPNN